MLDRKSWNCHFGHHANHYPHAPNLDINIQIQRLEVTTRAIYNYKESNSHDWEKQRTKLEKTERENAEVRPLACVLQAGMEQELAIPGGIRHNWHPHHQVLSRPYW